jgi:hypothetical protein
MDSRRPLAVSAVSSFVPRFYWVAYVSGGKRRFEGTKSERKIDAQELLTQRLGEAGAASASSTLVPFWSSSAPERLWH